MLVYGAVPVIAVLSGGSENPLLYTAVYAGAGAVSTAIYMLWKCRHYFKKQIFELFLKTFINKNKFVKRPSVLNILGDRSILLPIALLDSLVFAWSLQYIPSVIAAVILESWPIFFIFLLRRGGGGEYDFSARVASLFTINFFAVAIIILSDTRGDALNSFPVLEYSFGIFLIVVAMLFYLQTANRLRQSERLSKELGDKIASDKDLSEIVRGGGGGHTTSSTEIANVTQFLRFLGLVLASVISILFYLAFEIFDLFQSFNGNFTLRGGIVAVIGGTLVNLFGSLLGLRGTIAGKDLRVQSIAYLTPVAGILYLIALSPLQEAVLGPELAKGISDINWPWFLVGLIGVVSLTLITHFESEEERFGLTSLIVALWASGALIFFRDDWTWWRESIEDPIVSNLEYFAFLGTAATIFALLLGFQIGRNEERSRREDQLIFSLLDKLGILFSMSLDRRARALENLEGLDSARYVKDIKLNYDQIISNIDAEPLQTEADDISATKAVLNELAHSKQYGRRLSESIPIVLLGVFSIFLAISFRPSIDGVLQGITTDTFVFLLAAVVAYLIFHLFDIYSDRKSSNFTYDDAKGYRVNFQPSGSKDESVLASILVSVIVCAYIFLYFVKWFT